MPENVDRPITMAYTDTDHTFLGQSKAAERAAHPSKSGFRLLGSGLDAFVARAVLTEFAQRSIDAQYYLFHSDLTGNLLIAHLVKAADRGVRVRLLVDDMALSGRTFGAAVLDSHPNMSVRLFNPFSRNSPRALQFITRFGSVTRRMHNKSFTADNQVTILGGRNIGNEYFEAHPDLAFADLDVLAMGPAAKEVSTSFDRYWNSELAYPAKSLVKKQPTQEDLDNMRKELYEFLEKQRNSEYMEALRNSKFAEALRKQGVIYAWGDAIVIYDQPEKLLHGFGKKEFHLAPKLRPFIENLKKEFIIFSPYFVPGREGTEFLTHLVKKGVRVRILTNSLASNDVGIVHAGYAKYRRDLLRGGVELYEMNKKISKEEKKEKKGKYGSSKASLHAKSFIFDRKDVFIGSLNLDPRALDHNTEIGVVIDSKEIAEVMAKWFDENIEKLAFRLELKQYGNGFERIYWYGQLDGKPQVFNVDPYTGFFRRLGIGFMGLLPIESQL